ncbi:MAG: DUF2079 domain-containing protein [Frankiaceae bacterium]
MTVTRPGHGAPVTEPSTDGRPRLLPRGHRRGVLLLAGALLAGYALLSVLRHRALETTAFDLGIFFDAVHDWSRFSLPHVAVKGVHSGYGPGFDLLGDHFHPILALLAPTMWIWPHPVTLLVDQAALMAASVVPVWSYAARRLRSVTAAYAVALAYGLYWGIQTAVAFDFHEIAFAVPLIALAIERIDAGRWVHACIAIALLALVKEDLPILIAFFGLYVAWRGRRWLLGAALAAYGIASYLLITKVAMPAIAGHDYAYWSFGQLGQDLPHALWHIAAHPLSTAHLLVTPAVKWRTELMLFAPFAFLTLASPIAVLAVPLLAERFLSSGHQYWVTAFHYSATTAPVIAMGAADGLGRVLDRLATKRRAWWQRALRRWLPLAMAAAAVGIVAAFPFRELVAPRLWVGNAHIDAGHAAIAAVPSGVVVEASDEIQPHLADRTTALLLDGREHGAQYVVANVGSKEWPLNSLARQAAYVDRLRGEGWTVVLARDRYVVLRVPGARP